MNQTTSLPIFALLVFLCSDVSAQSTAPKLLPFQGRLTDQNGNAVSNGVRLVQFKIYDVPTGGSPVWAGELHRTTVNGGLVNVLLGSKTPFTGMDFDKQLYLEITVDINGDNSITLADPPMLPRQAILPVVFAKEAADSRLLDGHDWSHIFAEGATNPATAKISGERIVSLSITTGQLASNAVTTTKIAPGAVTGSAIANGAIGNTQIAAGAVGALQIAAGGIVTSNLGLGVVTLTNLASRTPGTNVGAGRIAWSLPVVQQTLTGGTFEDVSNLSVTIETTGRPVLAMVVPSLLNNYSNSVNDSAPSGLYFIANPGANAGYFRLVRDNGAGAVVTRFGSGAGGTQSVGYPSPMGPVFDLPPGGTHTYKLQWGFTGPTGGGYATIYNSVLVVFEL